MKTKAIFFLLLSLLVKLLIAKEPILSTYKIILQTPCQEYFYKLTKSLNNVAMQSTTCFTKFYGNTNSNILSKCVEISNNYYVIGSDQVKATLSKLDSDGNLIWTVVMEDTSSWNDIIVNNNNDLLLVGSKDVNLPASGGGPRDLLVGVCNSNGIFSTLYSKSYATGEAYYKIVKNSNPINSLFPYYVLGHYLQTSPSGVRVFISTLAENGNEGIRRVYNSSVTDQEFFQDISIANSAGDLDLIGLNNSASGHLSRINNNGFVVGSSVHFPANTHLLSTHQISNNGSQFQYLFGGIRNTNNVGMLVLFTHQIANNKIYNCTQLGRIYNVIALNNSTFYALGTGTFSGVIRTVVMKFTLTGFALNLNWSRFINIPNYDNSTFGRLNFNSTKTNLIYTEGRHNSAGSLSDYDGLFSVQDLEFTACLKDSVRLTFTQELYTTTNVTVTSAESNLNTTSRVNSLGLTWNQTFICQPTPPCNVDFTLNADKCGLVNFQATHNLGTGTSYCWDFGDAPPCASTIINPSHTYINNGNYTACVTVTNGNSNCNICKSIVVNNADKIPPVIICPNNYTVDICDGVPSTNISGTASATDNQGIPSITFKDFLARVSTCTLEYVREWEAIDGCGNISKCQQLIYLIDLKKPRITCPADITINCTQSSDTTVTGGPRYNDYCRPRPFMEFKNSTIFSSACSTVIKRTFYVEDDCLHEDSCMQFITILDNIAPFIFCSGSNVIPIECSQSPQFSTPNVIENNCGGKINQAHIDTKSISGCNTIYTRVWTITDQCGNSSTCEQQIKMIDTKPPVITGCGRKITVQGVLIGGECKVHVLLLAPSALDECSNTITINSINNTNDASGLFNAGIHIVSWTSSDECDNKSYCQDTIIILNCGNGCDPCNEIKAITREISIDSNSCCFAIDINNPCGDGYFGKLELECLSPEIIFGSHTKLPTWNYCTPVTPTSICVDYSGPSLPTGLTQNVLQFCVDSSKLAPEEMGCWKQVVFGHQHTIAIKLDGTLWAWGNNNFGQLGLGISISGTRSVPTQIGTDNDWMTVSAGNNFNMALKTDHSLWTWGNNAHGACGTLHPFLFASYFTEPIKIGNNEWALISAGSDHSLAIKLDGTLWAWGQNIMGQVGDGTGVEQFFPVKISPLSGWRAVSAGDFHSLAINALGNLYTWGRHYYDFYGTGLLLWSNSPIKVGLSNQWKHISAGSDCSAGILNDGSLWTWGKNTWGQLGNGDIHDNFIPIQIKPGTQWKDVAYGSDHHALGITNSNQLFTWGARSSGQSGDGIVSSFPNYSINHFQIASPNNWKNISAGYGKSCGITQSGSTWVWGHGGYYTLGNAIWSNSYIPIILNCSNNNLKIVSEEISIENIIFSNPYQFKLKFYKADDQTIACDTLLNLQCDVDTISKCISLRDVYAECDPKSNQYIIHAAIDNISLPTFIADKLIVTSPDANVLPISPIFLVPSLAPNDPTRIIQFSISTTTFPDPDGVIKLNFQLQDINGNIYCNQTVSEKILLPSCHTECSNCTRNTNPSQNLINNGDFENGNISFTSDYTYQSIGLLQSSEYSIRNSTNLTNGQWSCIDHTLGNNLGKFLVADGPFNNKAIWRQDVNIEAGQDYIFCFHANNLIKNLENYGPPRIGARIVQNGQIIIPTSVVNKLPDQWIIFTGNFSYPTSGIITIEIFNIQTSEWCDIAIDDISLIQCINPCTCSSIDNIHITGEHFDYSHKCEKQTKSYVVKCKQQGEIFDISGNLNCSESCAGRIECEIKSNVTGNIVYVDYSNPDPINSDWTIENIPIGLFIQGDSYEVSLLGICGRDTCTCNFNLYFNPCDTCGFKCCDEEDREDFEEFILGPITNNLTQWHNHEGTAYIIQGGCNGSSNAVNLPGVTRGYNGTTFGFTDNGINGPIPLFYKGDKICLKFCAKYTKAPSVTFANLEILLNNSLAQNVSLTTTWQEYQYIFTATSDIEEILFRNSNAGPLDAPPSIQLDQICFNHPIPIVNDQVPPIVDCPLSETITIIDSPCTHNYIIPNIIISDDNGILTSTIIIDGVITNIGNNHILVDGIHTIEITSIDYCNNISTCSYQITINCSSCICSNQASNPNLLTNGDFEDGNMGFQSGYLLNPNTGTNITSGQYDVRNSTELNNSSWACIDHTNSDPLGNFLIADGANPTQAVWSKTMNLNLNEEYNLCFFANNLVRPSFNSTDPRVEVRVNGVTILGPVIIPESPDIWVPINISFVPITNPVIIEIFNTATTGFADLALDDIALSSCQIEDSCICKEIFDVKFGNSEFTLSPLCNVRNLYRIPCPIQEKEFNIKARLNCLDSCNMDMNYEIEESSTSIQVASGSASFTAPNIFSLPNQLYSTFTPGTSYTLRLYGSCGQDSCICSVQFVVDPCDSCCDKKQFNNFIQSAFDVQLGTNCKVTVNYNGKTDCNIVIDSIRWKNGVVTYGPISSGGMMMYTYANVNSSYLIKIYVTEYDAFGKVCNQGMVTKSVSPNCENCCKDYKRFKQLTAQGLDVQVNGCDVTVSALQFGQCHYFETSPNFGDGSSVISGPFWGVQTWTHSYTQSGTYNICVTVYEATHNNPDSACYSRQLCKSITVDCTDSCECSGFTNLKFKYDKDHMISANCNDTIKLECPPEDCYWSLTGNLNCLGECTTSKVEWTITDVSNGVIIGTGTSFSYPQFGLYIPQEIVSKGGNYCIELIGYCDNKICTCKIYLNLEGCVDDCPCDPGDLEADLNAGIQIYSQNSTCFTCIKPIGLRECDLVKWYLLSNPNQTIAISSGTTIICYQFTSPGIKRLRLVVTRYDENGNPCDDLEKIFTFNLNCLENFNIKLNGEDCLIDYSFFNSEMLQSVDLTQRSNNQSLVLTPRFPIAISKTNYCLNSGQNLLTFNLKNNTSYSFGDRVKVSFVNSNNPSDIVTVGTILIDSLLFKNSQVQYLFSTSSSKCEYDNFVKYNLKLEYSNPIFGLSSDVEIENICLDNENKSDKTLGFNPTIYPNPSQGAFTVLLDSPSEKITQISIQNIIDNQIKVIKINPSSSKISFGHDLLPGVYNVFIKGNTESKRILIIKL